MIRKHLMFLFTIFSVVLSITSVGAATISYTATDLTDVNPGEDLWEYSYTLSDHSFAADTGFTIYFDLGFYDLLEPFPVAPNSDWDVITWDPDPALPDDGAYDAYALFDDASISDLFTVSFVWLGIGSEPGSQFFEIYDGVSWDVLDDGWTTSAAVPIPEPSTMLLLSGGLAGIAFFARRRKKE